jgi:hypothetical protein
MLAMWFRESESTRDVSCSVRTCHGVEGAIHHVATMRTELVVDVLLDRICRRILHCGDEVAVVDWCRRQCET